MNFFKDHRYLFLFIWKVHYFYLEIVLVLKIIFILISSTKIYSVLCSKKNLKTRAHYKNSNTFENIKLMDENTLNFLIYTYIRIKRNEKILDC